MKRTIVKFGLLALTVAFSATMFAQGQDGQAVFKSKCAMCHGQNAEGKIGPKLVGTKLGDDDIVLMLSKGKEGKKAPHNKPLNGLNDEQIKAVAHYVKSLK